MDVKTLLIPFGTHHDLRVPFGASHHEEVFTIDSSASRLSAEVMDLDDACVLDLPHQLLHGWIAFQP